MQKIINTRTSHIKFKLLFIFTLIFSSLPLCAMEHPSDLKKDFFDAIKRGNLEQIESCLRGGANPNLRITDATYGRTTPLIFAAENGYTAIVELLLAYHADVNFISCYFYTPLMRAAIKGHIEITKLLLDHRAHVNTGSFNHKTALHYAVEKNHTEIVNLLLDHGADTFIINASDSSLLALAAKHGLSASVNLLLKHGGNWEVKRALQLATKFGHFYTVEIILNHIIHILDKTDIETCLMWDNYILYSLNTIVPHRGTYTVETINAFRMLLHHADKLPLSAKKIESLL